MKSSLNQSGFTLPELLITIGIAGIMLGLATPFLQEIYYSNHALSYSNDLRVALYRTQNEAIRQNRVIILKPKTATNDYWQGGWNIYRDDNSDNTVDTNEIISTYIPNNAAYTLKASSSNLATKISFDAFGLPSNNGEFWVCRPDNSNTLSHTVKIELSGFISVTKGATCP